MQPNLWTLATLMALLAVPASAHELTLDECLEGSDFIRNAARSRDYGISREAFIGRIQSDLQAIQAFPPHLRWFVQDADDEALLVGFAELVFDQPKVPEAHQSEFLQACVARIVAAVPQDSEPSQRIDTELRP